jgi:hypothetical protein
MVFAMDPAVDIESVEIAMKPRDRRRIARHAADQEDIRVFVRDEAPQSMGWIVVQGVKAHGMRHGCEATVVWRQVPASQPFEHGHAALPIGYIAELQKGLSLLRLRMDDLFVVAVRRGETPRAAARLTSIQNPDCLLSLDLVEEVEDFGIEGPRVARFGIDSPRHFLELAEPMAVGEVEEDFPVGGADVVFAGPDMVAESVAGQDVQRWEILCIDARDAEQAVDRIRAEEAAEFSGRIGPFVFFGAAD